MHSRWPVFAALVLGAFTVAMFWYVVLSNPTGEAVPASGGRYVEGITRAPERMNPLFANANPADADVAALVFSGLVRMGPDGTPLPDLAERWEITGNGADYVFYLRQGVAWQDGEPFDADDVVFTYRAISQPGFKGSVALAAALEGVTVTARDASTVEFRLQQAYAPLLSWLTVGILPRHLLQNMDANQLYNAAFNDRPIGTGPYTFKRRTSGGGVELETNSTYYLGPPPISAVELRVFPDPSAVADALRTRQIDGALLGPQTSAAELAFLARDNQVAARELVSTTYNTVYLDTRAPVFSDTDVRRALWQALNVDALITADAGGRGEPIDTGIPRRSWAYAQVDVPTFDPGAAASSLERSGWARASDGIRRKGDVRLAFSLSTPNEPTRVALAEDIARQWRAIGADVQVQPIDAATYLQDHVLGRQFQAALVAVDPGPDPDPYAFWHSSQIVSSGGNVASFSDGALDNALERARQTTDIARRKELYAQVQVIIVQAAPQIPLFAPASTYVQSTRIKGVGEPYMLSPSARFADIGNWYIETRVKP
ncbi:MAG: peptide ABC transporter substrate-binding protein [Chloroflexi bacterium]|nr:peptide ABC transporter substrate-binding protein [Chloroflexota bacterium]